MSSSVGGGSTSGSSDVMRSHFCSQGHVAGQEAVTSMVVG